MWLMVQMTNWRVDATRVKITEVEPARSIYASAGPRRPIRRREPAAPSMAAIAGNTASGRPLPRTCPLFVEPKVVVSEQRVSVPGRFRWGCGPTKTRIRVRRAWGSRVRVTTYQSISISPSAIDQLKGKRQQVRLFGLATVDRTTPN